MSMSRINLFILVNVLMNSNLSEPMINWRWESFQFKHNVGFRIKALEIFPYLMRFYWNSHPSCFCMSVNLPTATGCDQIHLWCMCNCNTVYPNHFLFWCIKACKRVRKRAISDSQHFIFGSFPSVIQWCPSLQVSTSIQLVKSQNCILWSALQHSQCSKKYSITQHSIKNKA